VLPLKLLVIDDDYTAVTFVKLMAESLGHDTAYCLDGREATDAVLREMPDVILLDMQMPEKDGLEVLRTLKAAPETRRVPVVIHSGIADDPRLPAAFKNGAVCFLHKPATRQSLTKALETALGGGR